MPHCPCPLSGGWNVPMIHGHKNKNVRITFKKIARHYFCLLSTYQRHFIMLSMKKALIFWKGFYKKACNNTQQTFGFRDIHSGRLPSKNRPLTFYSRLSPASEFWGDSFPSCRVIASLRRWFDNLGLSSWEIMSAFHWSFIYKGHLDSSN